MEKAQQKLDFFDSLKARALNPGFILPFQANLPYHSTVYGQASKPDVWSTLSFGQFFIHMLIALHQLTGCSQDIIIRCCLHGISLIGEGIGKNGVFIDTHAVGLLPQIA